MKKEYFCDYFAMRKSGEVEWLELDYVKLIYTEKSFEPSTISARLLLSKITKQQKEWLNKTKEVGVEVIWVPYGKSYTLELTGELYHVKSGQNSYSFRIAEKNNETNEEEISKILMSIFETN